MPGPRRNNRTPRTLVHKIVAAHLVRGANADAAPHATGSFVRLRPHRVMTHDNTAAIIPKFESLFAGSDGAPRIADPTQLLLTLDHDVQNLTAEGLAKRARIRAFADRHRVTFHDAGAGVGHQLMLERGHVIPGALCVASDSHSNAYGALGALGIPIVRTDAAVVWATSEFWWRIPPVVRVELTGFLREGVSGKDVIVALCDRFRRDALNAAVEFTGPGLRSLPIADRIAIANMSTEWGACACVMEPDDAVITYLRDRAEHASVDALIPDAASLADRCCSADPGAEYHATITLDLSTVSPSVAGPNTVSRATPASALAAERIRIERAYLLSCTNARLDDFRIAADIARSRRVASHVTLYIAAASAETERAARRLGYWDTLLAAGALALPSGCGPCIGLGGGTVGPGETAISATNRNFPGRMGDRSAQVYLASPAVVIASAIAGYITPPDDAAAPIELRASVTRHRAAPTPNDAISADAAPITGRAIRIAEPDVSTDQIFAGKHTYRDNMTPADLAAVAFENLDPALTATLRPGDIILAGENFGTGSSREQAVTALLAAGVRAILCVSASETYQRNAINNGLLCIECPGLGEILAELTPGDSRIGPEVSIDAGAGVAHIGSCEVRFAPVEPFITELLSAGGLLSWTRRSLDASNPQRRTAAPQEVHA